MLVSYNTTFMHQTAKTIQNNADDLGQVTTNFWTNYQNGCVQTAIPHTLQTMLLQFAQKDSMENVLSHLIEQRRNIGQTLDQAATRVDQEEQKNTTAFTPK